ncbi:hypothetical protein EV651_12312 [Kribbella sp. VKM Ac-2571]|uniref:hypothetical protein n=1 Tax=Kribbella sp. VKM Ac-2571 TaxID=2512222 RepID=UPI0010D26B14|nr:hypothetical protein [Kribbella sp. VKM Ac-2571]TDO48246.1 hypothetical protein EV651_12312 [Kribbella sp. VKM Ac-2571]
MKNRTRSRRHWPVCRATGKRRLDELKDVKAELHAARSSRGTAALSDADPTWTVVSGYDCDACGGYHLTSRPKPTWTTVRRPTPLTVAPLMGSGIA